MKGGTEWNPRRLGLAARREQAGRLSAQQELAAVRDEETALGRELEQLGIRQEHCRQACKRLRPRGEVANVRLHALLCFRSQCARLGDVLGEEIALATRRSLQLGAQRAEVAARLQAAARRIELIAERRQRAVSRMSCAREVLENLDLEETVRSV